MTSPTAPTISATGITAPTFADIYGYLQSQYKAIFGSDIYLGNDSQDGQFLGIIAQAIADSNAAAIAVYNAYSPATAQGAGLSSVVKINGISRLVPSNSTATLTIVGVAGTVINNGVAGDVNGYLWNLPAQVIIPVGGLTNVIATCQTAGSIQAAIGAINIVSTPTLGWQTVTNAAAANVGAPVESDAALRSRQAVSTELPNQTVLVGLIGAIQGVPGVTRMQAFENDTSVTDANGIPPHSIAFVVQGGDATAIATAIAKKKTPGTNCYGTTTVNINDTAGVPHAISFYVPTAIPMAVAITLHALTNYSANVAAEIQAAVAAYINGLAFGQAVMITRLYVPAQLAGAADSSTFEIVSIAAAAKPGTPGASDVAILFNQYATCAPADVTITVV